MARKVVTVPMAVEVDILNLCRNLEISLMMEPNYIRLLVEKAVDLDHLTLADIMVVEKVVIFTQIINMEEEVVVLPI